ncbi:MAG: signal peptidase I [Gemmatimonadota bacterium]
MAKAREARKKRRGSGKQRPGTEGSRGAPAGGEKPSGAREKEEPEKKRRPAAWSVPWLVEWAKTLVFAFLIFIVLRSFVVESFVITSGSMEKTLLVGDFLLVNKTVFGSSVPGTPWRVPGYSEPDRGEIVVFRADHAPGLDIVKRLVGKPGDTLSMVEGVLFVNGRPQTEPYVRHDPTVPDAYDRAMDWQRRYLVEGEGREGDDGYSPTRDNWGPIVVPPERFFMLGDNREHSLDSRFWGFAERRKLKGKPFFVYYSYDKEALKPFRFLTAARLGRWGPFPP